MPFNNAFHGKRVLVTGHTGFKGSWLCEWLLMLGAKVTGYSLPPPTNPALFDQLGLADRLDHRLGDVRDAKAIRMLMDEIQPDFVFHLAAQPLVRFSYAEPVQTYATNVMGTVNLLEAVRIMDRPCVIVAITTDKCYENRESGQSYREDDPLGGHDPYSSSKAAAELVISAYRRSFFSAPDSQVRLASARAGNVMGGGDWAQDRILPDCIRALIRNEPVRIRNKSATRPWQHVLEPLGAYLWLGARLASGERQLATAFNFGPHPAANRPVVDVVKEVLRHWPGQWSDHSDPAAVHEAGLLNLEIEKAQRLLGWQPVWDFATTIEKTIAWYQRWVNNPTEVAGFTLSQITAYEAAACERGLPWST